MKTEETESDRETTHLLQSECMRQRLIEASQRTEGIPFEVALERLGLIDSGDR